MGIEFGRHPELVGGGLSLGVRSYIARTLVKDYEIPLAEIARHFGVFTSAVSKRLQKATE